jgi:hypothetical protein
MLDSKTQKLLKLSTVVRISDFSLPESQTIFKHETPGTIWNWMKQHRSGDQASSPTFMFPDINAGPDLVFLLQKHLTDSEEHKTRESGHRRLADIDKMFIISQVSILETTCCFHNDSMFSHPL